MSDTEDQTNKMPEKIDVAPPQIVVGDGMLGRWTVNQSTYDQIEYVRGDIVDGLTARVDELEDLIKFSYS